MDIDSLTIGEARRLAAMFCNQPATSASAGRWAIGKAYFVRTVTHHFVGRLEEVTEHELWFSSVAWVADDGRFNEMLKSGVPSEVEPAPDGDVPIGRGALIDAHLWPHALLRSVK